MKLDECRQEIDSLDAAIIDLLNRRAEVARNIGMLKAQAGLPIIDAGREDEILSRISAWNGGVLEEAAATRIYRQILIESRRVQTELVAGLGVKGEVAQ